MLLSDISQAAVRAASGGGGGGRREGRTEADGAGDDTPRGGGDGGDDGDNPDDPYPPGLKEVRLTEVVRCSERIVAGAMAFQLGGP